MLSDHGLTVDDLNAVPKPTRGRPSLKDSAVSKPKQGRPSLKVVGASAKKKPAVAAKKKSVLPDKYRNPKTGETWSGWARPPLWIKDVKDRSKFLINPDGQTPITINRKKGAKKVVARKAA